MASLILDNLAPFGPFSERFEKIKTLYEEPAFSWLLARDRSSGDLVRLQGLHLPTLESKTNLESQWQVLKSCGNSLWMRPQEFLQKNHWGLLLTWVPPGSPFNQTEKIQTDEVYLKWLVQGLQDLQAIHRLGLLHLAQNEGTWILFQADETEGEAQLGLSDLGLLTEVPLGRPFKVENALSIAPEILRGEPLGAFTDLYGLACLILKQRSAHLWENQNRLDQILRLHWDGRLVDWVPKTQTLLNDILRKMLAPESQDRPQSAADLLREIEGKSPPAENTALAIPPWAMARTQARQNTLILNAIGTLLKEAAGNFLEAKISASFRDLASEILECHQERFAKHLHAHYLYWKARADDLAKDHDSAAKWRVKALSEVYEQPDPKLKAMLWVDEAKAQGLQSGNSTQEINALENAWECAQHYPEPNFRQQILGELALRLKSQGQDQKALEKLHQAYGLSFETQDLNEIAQQIFLGAELGELLFNYHLKANAEQLLKKALSQIQDLGNAQESLDLTRTYLQAAVILGDSPEALTYFTLARASAQKQKILAKLLWVEAHHVRAFLEQQDYEQSRRQLKAITHRSSTDLPQEFLDFLELRLWLATGEPLWSHHSLWESRLEKAIAQAEVGRPFCEMAWPPFKTYEYLSEFLEIKQRFSEAQRFRARAQEQKEQIKALLKNLENFSELSKSSLDNSGKIKSPSSWFGSGALKVKSLLKETEETSTSLVKASKFSEEDSPKENVSFSSSEEWEIKFRQLETQFKIQQEAWQKEKALLENKILQLQKSKLPKTSVFKSYQERPVSASSVQSAQLTKPRQSTQGDLSTLGEKEQILKALQTHQGHRSLAAKHLGIHRRTLLEKLKKYGLEDLDFLPSRESILQALAAHQGQKSKAAQQLGLSRATFYRRLKELGIGEED